MPFSETLNMSDLAYEASTWHEEVEELFKQICTEEQGQESANNG